MQPLTCILDRGDAFLEDNLLRYMLKTLAREPAPMRQRPVIAASRVDSAMAQQEREQLLALAAQIVPSRLPCSDKIADRLVDCVRYPHPGQLASPMQPRQRDRVPPVGLDPLTRPLRDQSRGNHQTSVAQFLDLPMQPVAVGPASQQKCSRLYRLPRLFMVRLIPWSGERRLGER